MSVMKDRLQRLQAFPPIVWSLLGFLPPYLLFFLRSQFFSGPQMDTLGRVVPTMSRLGSDLTQTLEFVQAWLGAPHTPYVGTATYPPLAYVLLLPFLWIDPAYRYLVIFALTLVAFGVSTLFLPLRTRQRGGLATEVVLVFASGLMSYSLLFELERGQFNMIAVVLAYLAVWIFHSGKASRLWAYILFCASVQLKLYPFIFILLLVEDWRLWKTNLLRLGGLALSNAALFLVLGPRIFVDFINAIGSAQSGDQSVYWANHSIHSFLSLAFQGRAGGGGEWMAQHLGLLQALFLALVVLPLFLILRRLYTARSTGLSPHLLMACALEALVIPPVSHDYSLIILAGPVAVLLCSVADSPGGRGRSLAGIAAITLFALAYSSTLYPLGYKPGFLLVANNLPAILTMLLVTTFMAWWWPPPASAETPEA